MADKPWLGSTVTEPLLILVERDIRECEATFASCKTLFKNRARVALVSEMLAMIHQMLTISVFSLRKLIESLTVNGRFSDGLLELVNVKLIQKGDRQDRKMDAELLQAVYGYCSTLGSHAGPHKTDLEHARLAVSLTESAVYFLLRRIVTYRSTGGQLQHWV